MNLKLYCDNTIIDIDFWKEYEPGEISELNDDIIFYDNKQYSIYLDEEDTYELYVNNEFVEDLASNMNFSKFFGNVQFYLKDKKTQKIFSSDYYCVSSDKISSEDFEIMLNDILENCPTQVLVKCFGMHNSELNPNKKISSINTKIKAIENIIVYMVKNLHHFEVNAKSKLSPKYKKVDYSNISDIDSITISYMAENCDEWFRTSTSGIKINKKYFLPNKVMTKISVDNKAIYENKSIVNFLNYLRNELLLIEKTLENAKNGLIRHYRKLKKLYPNSNIVESYTTFYYEKLNNKASALKKELTKILMRLQKSFSCCADNGYCLPAYTHIFRQIPMYRQMFLFMLDYDNLGENLETKINYFVDIIPAYTIYELYCLNRIIEGISILGGQNKNFFNLDNDGLIFSSYLEIDDVVIKLYYEPKIMKSQQSLSLDVADYYIDSQNNIQLKKVSKQGFVPDFVIEILKDNKINYVILDAKFSKRSSVDKYHLSNIINKYVVSIIPKDSYTFKLMTGIMCLNGDKTIVRNQRASLGYEQIEIMPININTNKIDVKDILNMIC